MIKRPFNKTLYDTFDAPAREILANHLKTKGHTIVSNTEDYNVDVVSQKGGITYYNEAEVKVAWKHDWPTHWKEIRIPERKKRLLKMYDEGVLNFYVFRNDMKQAWRIKDTLMNEDSLQEIKARWVVKGEKFFHIPYTKAELVEING